MIDLRQTIQQEATTLATLCDTPALDICKEHNIEPHATDANWHKMILLRGQSEILLDLLAQAGMYDPDAPGPTTRDADVRNAEYVLPPLIGKFIAIPAWSAAGRVQSVRWAERGSKQAIEIVLKESSTDPASKWKTFYLEPAMYEIIHS